MYLPKKRPLKHAKNGNKIISSNILYFTLFTDKIGFEPMILHNKLIFKTSALNHSATYPNFNKLFYFQNKDSVCQLKELTEFLFTKKSNCTTKSFFKK